MNPAGCDHAEVASGKPRPPHVELSVARMLARLGVTPGHQRPAVIRTSPNGLETF